MGNIRKFEDFDLNEHVSTKEVEDTTKDIIVDVDGDDKVEESVEETEKVVEEAKDEVVEETIEESVEAPKIPKSTMSFEDWKNKE